VPILSQTQGAAGDNGWQIGQVFQDRDGDDFVILLFNRYLRDIRKDLARTRSQRAVLPKLGEGLDRIVNICRRLVRQVIERASAEF
jgi:hypothetical protein